MDEEHPLAEDDRSLGDSPTPPRSIRCPSCGGQSPSAVEVCEDCSRDEDAEPPEDGGCDADGGLGGELQSVGEE